MNGRSEDQVVPLLVKNNIASKNNVYIIDNSYQIMKVYCGCRSPTNAINSLFHEQKWNESGFRPPLCTYRLNWARRTSWGWWDDWDDTVLQTQDSKFEPWRSEAEHATSRSRRLPTILTFTRGWGRNIFVSFKPPRPGTEPRTLAWKTAVLATTLGPPPISRAAMCFLPHDNSSRAVNASEFFDTLLSRHD